MTDADLQEELIARAEAGDCDAGREALRYCRDGLENGQLAPIMRDHLIKCLTAIVEDQVEASKALCLAEDRGRGGPKKPLPEWQTQLGAVAALFVQHGLRPQQINDQLDLMRQEVFGKPLDGSTARKIRQWQEPMTLLDEDLLLHLAGPYRAFIPKYLPSEK